MKFRTIRKKSKNPIPMLRRKLTTVFNKYVRLRDAKLGCISCGGKVENAGHFKSRGANPRPSMAFDEKNVNGQCIRCNYTLGGNLENYKIGLIKKYGVNVIQELEIKNSIPQNPWLRFEYEAMIDYYSRKVSELLQESCDV